MSRRVPPIFCKHKMWTDFVTFSVEMPRRNSATELLFTNTLECRTIPLNIRGCPSGTRLAGQKIFEEHLQSSNGREDKNENTTKYDKQRGKKNEDRWDAETRS